MLFLALVHGQGVGQIDLGHAGLEVVVGTRVPTHFQRGQVDFLPPVGLHTAPALRATIHRLAVGQCLAVALGNCVFGRCIGFA
ncbi:hypothetical protein D3C72_2303890 [compost metagenome]